MTFIALFSWFYRNWKKLQILQQMEYNIKLIGKIGLLQAGTYLNTFFWLEGVYLVLLFIVYVVSSRDLLWYI